MISLPTNLLDDFMLFLDYCEKQKPTLTKSRSFLNRKSLFELNQQMFFKQADVNPKTDQHFYLSIHFFYHLTLAARLFRIEQVNKSKICFIPASERINEFRQLSPIGQYLSLINIYWVHCDWEVITSPEARYVETMALEVALPDFIEMAINQPYLVKDHKSLNTLSLSLHQHLTYWELLGWVTVELNRKVESRSFFVYKKITLTGLGKTMLSLLVTERPFSEWNKHAATFDTPESNLFGNFMLGDYDEDEDEEDFDEDTELSIPKIPASSNGTDSEYMDTEEIFFHLNQLEEQAREEFGVELDIGSFLQDLIDQNDTETLQDEDKFLAKLSEYIQSRMEEADFDLEEGPMEPFETAFTALFNGQDIPTLSLKVEEVIGLYTLKVSLAHEPKIWRTIEIDFEHTLEYLHLAIQEAFEFENDHIYCFYKDKNNRRNSYNDPRGGQGPFANEYGLADLELSVGQRFYYLFDFGDNWLFTIDLIHIDPEADQDEIRIVEVHGAAPEQYPDYEE